MCWEASKVSKQEGGSDFILSCSDASECAKNHVLECPAIRLQVKPASLGGDRPLYSMKAIDVLMVGWSGVLAAHHKMHSLTRQFNPSRHGKPVATVKLPATRKGSPLS